EAMECGVERTLLDGEHVVREQLNAFRDCPPVQRSAREGLEDQEIECALEQIRGLGHAVDNDTSIIDNTTPRSSTPASEAVCMRGALIVLVLCSAAGAAAGDRTADVRLRDVGGKELRPFATGSAASVVFFVATDCPVSNAYAPEIQRVC